MKINKVELSAIEKLQEDIIVDMKNYYSRNISENIKRGLMAKRKLSEKNKVAM